MSFVKRNYVDGETVITAQNLNDIQDELIRQGEQQAEDEAELALKANTADVQTALALKADKTDTYTKAQVDSMLQEAVEEAVKESEYSNFEMKSVSGDFIHITDGAGLIPVKDLKIGIDAVQDLHGYDAPWVGGVGKNKFDIEQWLIDSNATYTKNGNTYTITATTGLYRSPFYFSDTDIAVSLSAKSYVAGSATNIRLQLVDKDGNVVTGVSLDASSDYRKVENVVGAGVRFNWSTAGTFTITEPMIELGSTATTYAPYSNICPISGWTGANIYVSPTADEEDATVYSITWETEAGTVYGGTLDVTTGELVVDWKQVLIDGENLKVTEWGARTYGYAVYISLSDYYRSSDASAVNTAISDTFFASAQGTNDMPLGSFIGVSGANSTMSFILPSTITSKAEANAWFAQNPTNVVYELTEPITYTISPIEVLTLLGENNIFADTGAVEELIYRISRQ